MIKFHLPIDAQIPLPTAPISNILDPMLWFALIPVLLTALLAAYWLSKRRRRSNPNARSNGSAPQRTLFDWVSLLAVPVFLGAATVAISTVQFRVEERRASEQAIQSFIDRISALVLEEEIRDPRLIAVGRAQTEAVLQLLSPRQSGRVLVFLGTLDLLHPFSPRLVGLDLTRAELKGLNFTGMDFEGTTLTAADLEDSLLRNVDFEEATLRQTELKNADLTGSSFEFAQMRGADLDHADLRGADLSRADGLTRSQLAEACGDASTLLPPEFDDLIWDTSNCRGEAEDD